MIQSSLSQQDLLFFVTLCRLQSLTVSAQKLNLSLSSAGRHGPSAQGDQAA